MIFIFFRKKKIVQREVRLDTLAGQPQGLPVREQPSSFQTHSQPTDLSVGGHPKKPTHDFSRGFLQAHRQPTDLSVGGHPKSPTHDFSRGFLCRQA
jgi:hypothetical protein